MRGVVVMRFTVCFIEVCGLPDELTWVGFDLIDYCCFAVVWVLLGVLFCCLLLLRICVYWFLTVFCLSCVAWYCNACFCGW